MKKILLVTSLLAITSAAYSQFSDIGYKKLKLGSTMQEAKKICSFKLDEYNSGETTIDGEKLEISFTEIEGKMVLWSISSKK